MEPGAAAIEQAFINRPDLDIFMGRAFLKAIADINGDRENVTAFRLKDGKFRSGTARRIVEDLLSSHVKDRWRPG